MRKIGTALAATAGSAAMLVGVAVIPAHATNQWMSCTHYAYREALYWDSDGPGYDTLDPALITNGSGNTQLTEIYYSVIEGNRVVWARVWSAWLPPGYAIVPNVSPTRPNGYGYVQFQDGNRCTFDNKPPL